MRTYLKIKREGLIVSMLIFVSTATALLYELIRHLMG